MVSAVQTFYGIRDINNLMYIWRELKYRTYNIPISRSAFHSIRIISLPPFGNFKHKCMTMFLRRCMIYILRSAANFFLALSPTYFKVSLTWWTIQRWYSVLGNTTLIDSLIIESPSAQRIRISFTHLFFNSIHLANTYCFHSVQLVYLVLLFFHLH